MESDVLLVFDHETGQYVAAPILFIERDGGAEYTVINLTFSNGTTTRLIYEHGLFDLTLNRYVYITEQNFSSFIGHEFAVLSEHGYETVTMTDAYLTTEYTGCYSLTTAYHLNYFIDGFFSMPGGIEGLFNFFEYDENLRYDEEQMAEDIAKYGLYTYEDFAPYLPEELYYAFQAPYFKVAVGKGMITFEEIIANTKFGLFAKEMGGGSVNPATGEFNFAVNVAYMIEDGKITRPVKGATLVGSGKDVLLRIDMIANNLEYGYGMCGSQSGSIPTIVGQPTIRVSHMTVGGKGGNK